MMRMFEWTGRLTLVAMWLLLAAPAHAGGASLNHDYGSSGPEAPASLDVSQPAVNFSLYDAPSQTREHALDAQDMARPEERPHGQGHCQRRRGRSLGCSTGGRGRLPADQTRARRLTLIQAARPNVSINPEEGSGTCDAREWMLWASGPRC